jgi:hypothetical protein
MEPVLFGGRDRKPSCDDSTETRRADGFGLRPNRVPCDRRRRRSSALGRGGDRDPAGPRPGTTRRRSRESEEPDSQWSFIERWRSPRGLDTPASERGSSKRLQSSRPGGYPPAILGWRRVDTLDHFGGRDWQGLARLSVLRRGPRDNASPLARGWGQHGRGSLAPVGLRAAGPPGKSSIRTTGSTSSPQGMQPGTGATGRPARAPESERRTAPEQQAWPGDLKRDPRGPSQVNPASTRVIVED